MKYNQLGVKVREKALSLTLLWQGLCCVNHLSFVEVEVQKRPYLLSK